MWEKRFPVPIYLPSQNSIDMGPYTSKTYRDAGKKCHPGPYTSCGTFFRGPYASSQLFRMEQRRGWGGEKKMTPGCHIPLPIIKSHRPVPIRLPTPVWDQKFENLWDHDPMLPPRRAIWVLGRAIWVLGRALWDRSHR